MAMKESGVPILTVLVLTTVLIQLVVAALLKELTLRSVTPTGAALVLAAAMALNGLRFVVWGYTHRHFPLSRSYPLTALFFPCILLVSAWYGETIGAAQVVGVGVIMLGLWLMNFGDASDG